MGASKIPNPFHLIALDRTDKSPILRFSSVIWFPAHKFRQFYNLLARFVEPESPKALPGNHILMVCGISNYCPHDNMPVLEISKVR